MGKAVMLLILLAGLVIEASAMVNLTAQRVYEASERKMPMFSLGLMHRSAWERQYFEAGAMIRPVAGDASVGTYGGYYYAVWPIFRPGMMAGIVFKKQNKWGMGLYYGLSIQAGILTFVASGEGIGGGLNIPLRLE